MWVRRLVCRFMLFQTIGFWLWSMSPNHVIPELTVGFLSSLMEDWLPAAAGPHSRCAAKAMTKSGKPPFAQ